MLTMLGRLHRLFAIFAFTAVSFALAQQAAAQQRWTNDAGKTITATSFESKGRMWCSSSPMAAKSPIRLRS